MSKLAQIYSQSTGLKAKQPFICKKMFPLEEGQYLTIQPYSKNQTSKCYDYWNEVMSILSPVLKQNNLKVYQIGEKDEPVVYGCTSLLGQTSICQANYVIQNSILHLSADSFTAHVAGALGVRQVSIYGNTDSTVHGPYWRGNAILIDSHRNNRKPSFSHEHDKTINKIPPEQIVNAVLSLLGANITINRKSLFFGTTYTTTCAEIVPDVPFDPTSISELPMAVRMDYSFNEQNLELILSKKKVVIVTNKDLNIEMLSRYKSNIGNIVIIYDKDSSISIDFIKKIKLLGAKHQIISFEKDETWIANERLSLFGIAQITRHNKPSREDFLNKVREYTNSESDVKITDLLDKKIWIRSNKFILSNNKIFLSYLHYKHNTPTNSFENNITNFVDHDDLYVDVDNFYIFEQNV